jgi:hypothetical protein
MQVDKDRLSEAAAVASIVVTISLRRAGKPPRDRDSGRDAASSMIAEVAG